MTRTIQRISQNVAQAERIGDCENMEDKPKEFERKGALPNGRIEEDGVEEEEAPRHQAEESPLERSAGDCEDDDDDEEKLVIDEETVVKSAEEGAAEVKVETAEDSRLNAGEKRPLEEWHENSGKRKRVEENCLGFDEASIEQVEELILLANQEIKGLEGLIKQKEEEWNALLYLLKQKELNHARLQRYLQVLKIRKDSEDKISDIPENLASSSPVPFMTLRQLLSDSFICKELQGSTPIVTTKQENTEKGSISIIDIHTCGGKSGSPNEPPRISLSSDVHNKLSKQLSSIANLRPILPKGGTVPTVKYSSASQGRHGPTVSVQQLIAAHREKYPAAPPIRGARRGAWRQKYEGDKKGNGESERPSSVSSSNSETDTRNGNSVASNPKGTPSLPPMNDPAASYVDFFLQMAQLTQSEKNSMTPQISIIPVTSTDCSAKSEANQDSQLSKVLSSGHQAGLEGSSALAKLLLESRSSGNGSPLKKLTKEAEDDPMLGTSQYLTLSALLSGGSTTTFKDSSAPLSIINIDKKPEENSNPKCQGCQKYKAQFVCAGCGNQWYCSRECQVAAWEDHSEHCSS